MVPAWSGSPPRSTRRHWQLYLGSALAFCMMFGSMPFGTEVVVGQVEQFPPNLHR
jgi:hypothetical protein